MILDEIVQNKRREVAERQQRVPLDEMMRLANAAPPPRSISFDLMQKLAATNGRATSGRVAVIGEVKRRSPSRGALVETVDPVERARAYEGGGVAAISVLTDDQFFGGSFEDLRQVRGAVSVPILCKDFILTPYQVYEARSHGADLILLIAAAIDDETLIGLQNLTLELGMMPLVEVHDQHDLARALAAGARLIGINNRDLKDFSVDLVITEYLAPLVPDDVVTVSESGIATRDDVQRAIKAGARAVLVGETLMRCDDPRSLIEELVS